MLVPAIFTVLFGLFFALIGYKFTFQTRKIIRRFQEMKYNSSSEPNKQARVMTKIFGVTLMIIGIYFVLVGINILLTY
jgi:uncharacterized membrane protein YfcA